ncbi:hypothetical protein NSTC745_01741 [Nostoc sp. DSM 114161]|uniref:hypothetical protein n=1 Tax=Nostoc sp. DSM 114161 TaxID=3440143 RepID=UPI00404591EF
MKSYTDVYKDYMADVYPHAEEEYSWYKKADNLRDAVKKAFRSEDECGKVNSHQCLVGRACLAEATEIALKRFDNLGISSFDSFDTIHQFVESVSAEVKHFGPLATYDVALRIAKYLDLELQEVYLHKGVTIGARALGFNVKDGDIMPVEEFPAPFNKLSGDHLENLLCIYKKVLANSSAEVGKTCIRPKTNSSCIRKKGCS